MIAPILQRVTVCYGFPVGRRLVLTAVAGAAALVVAWMMFKLFLPFRRGDRLARFFARAVIFASGTVVFAGSMFKLGGECVFSGPTKGNGFNSTPFTARHLLIWALVFGLVGGLFAPAAFAARGKKLDW